MILEQPRLGSDPPNGSGRERGATSIPPSVAIPSLFMKEKDDPLFMESG